MGTISDRTSLEALVPLVGYHLDPAAVQRVNAEAVWQANCTKAGFNLSDFLTSYRHTRVVSILSTLKLLKLSGSLGFLLPAYNSFCRRLEAEGSLYAAERLAQVLEIVELYHTGSVQKGATTGISVANLADHMLNDDIMTASFGATLLSSLPALDGMLDNYFRSLTLNSLVLWREHSLAYQKEYTMRSFNKYSYVNVRRLITSSYDVNGFSHGWYSTHQEALQHAFDLLHLDDFGYQASSIPIGSHLTCLTLIDPTLLIGISRFQAWPSFSDLHNAREVYSVPVESDNSPSQFYWLCHANRGLKCGQMMHNCYISGNWGMNTWPVLDSRVLSSNVLAAPFLSQINVGEGYIFSDPVLAQAKDDLYSFVVSTVRTSRRPSVLHDIDAALVLLTGVYRQPNVTSADFPLMGSLWNLYVEQQLAIQDLAPTSEMAGLSTKSVSGGYLPRNAGMPYSVPSVKAQTATGTRLAPQDWNESLLDSKL